jgi:hypothetical protein
VDDADEVDGSSEETSTDPASEESDLLSTEATVAIQ